MEEGEAERKKQTHQNLRVGRKRSTCVESAAGFWVLRGSQEFYEEKDRSSVRERTVFSKPQ